MNRIIVSFLSLFLLSLCNLVLFAEEIREWESVDGRKISAKLLNYDPEIGYLEIRRDDGVEFRLSADQLSEKDHAYLSEYLQQIEERRSEAAALAGESKTFSPFGETKGRFHVYFPSVYSADSEIPMLILFSSVGGGRRIMEQFRDAGEENGWIVVGCDYFRNNMDEDEALEVFPLVLEEIESAVPHHDPNRLYLGGLSGGAWRAFVYSVKFDRPWKGIISCGGWLGREPERDYPENLAVAFVNGDEDEAANHYVPRDTKILEKHNGTAKLFEFPGGHVVGPTWVLSEAMKWVDDNTGD
ncbi:MAG: hypothetical protein JJT75_00620 [Opitutales bacterium]|nr:hypothetical protein [Opitutales bacterium]MCH8541461.1 hypothetical protein [Opitutales bacterium]